jgi:tetratricopeptide (TPR) repeat protein
VSTDVFKVLIHHNLVSELRRAGRELRTQLQKTFERLQFGYWDNGTRVKRLKGVARPVYEARINRGDRLLFTVGRGVEQAPPHRQEFCILAWDVVVHDDVDGRARRMNIQPESGFLDFEPVETLAIDGVPACPDPDLAAAEALGPALADQNAANADSGLADSIRWYELDPDVVMDDGEWQALLDDPSLSDFELKLSLEQAETVFAPGPLLLRGTAGSGKTTVSVYRLARLAMEDPGARILYVTYSAALLETVRQLYQDLFRARRREPPANGPTFTTFPALYAELAHRDSGQRPEVVRYPHFARWYETLYGRDDAALAWEEIRGIIKGACLDVYSDHLDLAAYQALGRKRAPLFTNERPRLYSVYRRYCDWCRGDARADDIDMARGGLRALTADPAQRWDHVVCDEGQDLTELELELLIRLVRDVHHLFFAADPQQIVNPSGFRWAELRTLLRQHAPGRGAPEIRGLHRNFRSVHSIVSLANRLVEIKRTRTGRSDDDDLQTTTLRGASPVLVSGDEDEVLSRLRDFGPRCAVIVGSADEAARVSRAIASERVFDVQTVKGLEFDACVLWGVIGDAPAVWQALLASDAPMKEDPVARRAIHHAYVAVTRARRYLGVYERDSAAVKLWQTGALHGQLEHDEPAALARFMVFAATPEAWEDEGDYFQARGRFRQAAECYHRAGATDKASAAAAGFHESVGEWTAAAEIYAALAMPEREATARAAAGEHTRAADLYFAARAWAEAAAQYEAAGRHDAAARSHQNAGDTDAYRRCRLQDFVARRQWADAAKLAAKQGDIDAAINYYRRAGNRQQAEALRLQQATAGGDHERAAELLERRGDFDAAAEAYTAAGNRQRALLMRARAAEEAADFGGAAELWDVLGRDKEARRARARAAEAAGDWLNAADEWEALGLARDVRRCLAQSSAVRATTWLRALDRMKNPTSLLEAAEDFEAAGRYEMAEDIGGRAGKVAAGGGVDPERVERAVAVRTRCLMRQLWALGNVEAALALDHDGQPATVRLHAQICEAEERWGPAARAFLRVDDFGAAERCMIRTGNDKDVARVRALAAEEAGELMAAGDFWEDAGRMRNANKARAAACEAVDDWLAAADWYEQANMPRRARDCRKRANAGDDGPAAVPGAEPAAEGPESADAG